jgi:hypothetical protein
MATDDAVPSDSLEAALAHTEAAAGRALDASADLVKALRRLRTSAQVGNLRDLRAMLATVREAGERADDEAEAAADSWQLDEDAYFSSGRFSEELLAAAEAAGLQLFERDERFYCYPVLVRVAPAERSVFVDRARERRIRPSVLVEHLREVQRRPPRFRPEAFLDALFRVYGHLVAKRGPDQLDAGLPVPLVDVYELMTLMPGAAREYSRQEFARDIYLLDRGGVTTTRRGYVVSFPASTGARSGAALRVVNENGQEKVYYGIAFAPGG